MSIEEPFPSIPATPGSVPVDVGGDISAVTTTLPDGHVEPPPASKTRMFVFILTMFIGQWALLSPVIFSVAYKVQIIDAANKETSLGIIVGIGAIFNLVAGPLFGVLSDRTRTRFGRRRPWIGGGLVVVALGGLILAVAPTIVLVGVGSVIYTLGIAAAFGSLTPFMAESLPSLQRGRVGALVGVGAQLSGVVAVLLGGVLLGNLLVLFLLPVAAFAMVFVLYAIVVPDELPPRSEHRDSPFVVLSQLVFDPRKHRDFALVWIGKFCMQVGLTFLSTYQLYFLLDRLGLAPAEAGQRLALVGGIGVLVTTLFAILGGFLSDKLKRRKPFIYAGTALSVAGLLALAFAHDVTTFAVSVSLVLASAGLFGSVDLALATDVIPERTQAGRWMGIYYVSNSLSSAIAPVFAPLILVIGGGRGNYTALYIVGAVVALGAALAASGIKAVR
ncbi:MAG: MFS transporter [Actinobacteria bacterium]|nr:MFS transporter [Actinomycetota bacterium]